MSSGRIGVVKQQDPPRWDDVVTFDELIKDNSGCSSTIRSYRLLNLTLYQ